MNNMPDLYKDLDPSEEIRKNLSTDLAEIVFYAVTQMVQKAVLWERQKCAEVARSWINPETVGWATAEKIEQAILDRSNESAEKGDTE